MMHNCGIKTKHWLKYCMFTIQYQQYQGDHSPGKHGKPGKVRELQSVRESHGKFKVREKSVETEINFIIQFNYQWHTHNRFYGSLDFVWDNPGEPVPEETFTHSFIYYDPWHLPCSVYVPGSLFPQSLSKFSLVYLLAWHPPHHTPYISSPNHCFFAAHAHNIANCFAVVPRLCHLILVSFSTLFLELDLELNATHPSDHSHLCPLTCHLIFLNYGPGLTSMQHSTSHTTAVQVTV